VLWGAHPTQPIGVDIESLRPQIEKIKSKFCRPEELEFAVTPVQTLLIWSAKEAMYKAYGKKEIDFREQMRVHSFTGFSENGELEKTIPFPPDSLDLSGSVEFSEISNSTESTIPQKQNSEPETIQFSGELWGDKHYQFDLFARWYDPFVVVWAAESKSAH
jgi:4'-phosphopantetheinyl transferase EntD